MDLRPLDLTTEWWDNVARILDIVEIALLKRIKKNSFISISNRWIVSFTNPFKEIYLSLKLVQKKKKQLIRRLFLKVCKNRWGKWKHCSKKKYFRKYHINFGEFDFQFLKIFSLRIYQTSTKRAPLFFR